MGVALREEEGDIEKNTRLGIISFKSCTGDLSKNIGLN
jgi:hypothetical protein